MPITVRWYDEAQHIMIWDIATKWTIEEFYQALDTTRSLADTTTEPVNVIVDAQAVIERPNTNLLPHFRHALSSIDLQSVVYLRTKISGSSVLIEMLVGAVLRMAPHLTVKDFKFAKTVPEALSYIKTAQR